MIIAASALVIPVLYFLFIAHYGVDSIYWDEWDNVGILHAALHGHLAWKELWIQRNENRMLIPNLVFIGFARFGHFDTKSIMYLSAILLSLGYLSLLVLYRIYARHWLGPLFTVLFGAVWFSLADWENALWGFQLAWYLILFSAMAAMLCLSLRRITALSTAAAIGLAVIASYSSLQGLILWPIGLLILVWRIRYRPKLIRFGAVWTACGFVTTALYFKGFNFSPSRTGGSSVGFAIHHPVGMIKYFLAAVGNVFPGDLALRTHELLGLVLSLAAVYVFYRNCRETPEDRGTPLPAALILFAFLFDLSIALGRVGFGVGQALSSRYTMANLLLLVGIAVYLVSLEPGSEVRHSDHRRSRRIRIGVAVVLALFLMVQIGVSTNYGIENARAEVAQRTEAARVTVNLSKMTKQQQSLFIKTYLYPDPAILKPLIRDAKQDQLGEFAPGLQNRYVKDGPPPPWMSGPPPA
jgi:hypothetical protein